MEESGSVWWARSVDLQGYAWNILEVLHFILGFWAFKEA